jgi:hypothetical protein
MVHALTGKQPVRQLPSTHFKQENAKRDHSNLPLEFSYEKHCANNERHAYQRKDSIKYPVQRSQV